ncbi:MAG: hypothetical protein FRX49_10506 [Trebouxia sp. A1-2]|nr:MAG: hypothetical protein FRX49_10506 [Trebouxia sp. A1-2]
MSGGLHRHSRVFAVVWWLMVCAGRSSPDDGSFSKRLSQGNCMGLNDSLLNALGLHVIQLCFCGGFPQVPFLCLYHRQLIAGCHPSHHLLKSKASMTQLVSHEGAAHMQQPTGKQKGFDLVALVVAKGKALHGVREDGSYSTHRGRHQSPLQGSQQKVHARKEPSMTKARLQTKFHHQGSLHLLNFSGSLNKQDFSSSSSDAQSNKLLQIGNPGNMAVGSQDIVRSVLQAFSQIPGPQHLCIPVGRTAQASLSSAEKCLSRAKTGHVSASQDYWE